MINLPIDVVPGSSPPRFLWRQIIDSPIGSRILEHEGCLPPNVEEAVKALVYLAKELQRDNEKLKADLKAALAPPNKQQGATPKGDKR